MSEQSEKIPECPLMVQCQDTIISCDCPEGSESHAWLLCILGTVQIRVQRTQCILGTVGIRYSVHPEYQGN